MCCCSSVSVQLIDMQHFHRKYIFKKKNRKSVTFVFSTTTPSLKRNNFFLYK